jgi:hypothetical protein
MRKPSHTDQPAEIVREYGPFPGAPRVNGVSFDGNLVWFAGGEKLQAFEPASGKPVRALDVACDAGTAFDGRHLFQIAQDRIHKIDPATGAVLSAIPAPGRGRDSGLTWAEGTLWVGQHRDRKIHQIDPDTGAILRTIESNRHVTGVTWVDGELWHGTWEGDEADIRQVDPESGEVLARLTMPEGTGVSGLESDQAGLFYGWRGLLPRSSSSRVSQAAGRGPAVAGRDPCASAPGGRTAIRGAPTATAVTCCAGTWFTAAAFAATAATSSVTTSTIVPRRAATTATSSATTRCPVAPSAGPTAVTTATTSVAAACAPDRAASSRVAASPPVPSSAWAPVRCSASTPTPAT